MKSINTGGNKTGALAGFQQDFYGNDFTWFLAMVEEVYTAEEGYDKLNRVKIRIWGLHDHAAPISECPLAQVMMPTTVGGVHNNSSIHGLEKGAQVIGFWLDRHNQHPVIMGSLPGISPEENRSAGDVGKVVSLTQGSAAEGEGAEDTDVGLNNLFDQGDQGTAV